MLTLLTRAALSLALPIAILTHDLTATAAPLPTAQIQPGPPSTSVLFVPEVVSEGKFYVPLSNFKPKTSAGTVSLTVHPEVLASIPSGPGSPLRVALRKPSGVIQIHASPIIRQPNGQIIFGPGFGIGGGDCVVVSESLLQDYDGVVTHWNADANDPDGPGPVPARGGQEVGKFDGLRNYGYVYDPQSPDPHRFLKISDVTGNAEPLVWQSANGTPYAFASDKFALFSDGSGLAAVDFAPVPAYERYIGENYSISKYNKLAAVLLSDRIRRLTGFPVAHRNHPNAFPVGASADRAVQDDLKVFQVVHCHVVAPEDDTTLVGNEQSLATFMLPPGWKSLAEPTPSTTYPVLFNGFYDINENTFGDNGLSMAQTLAALHCQTPSRTAVGVLWNGGGAIGPYSLHRSAFTNAEQLFEDVENLIDGNKDNMVFTGGSRGGVTALAIAAGNPHATPTLYTAKFVHARAPLVRMGTTIGTSEESLIDPTRGGLLISIDAHTGYQGSWQTSWDDGGTPPKTGRQLLLETLVGTSDISDADDLYSLDSAPFRSALFAKGTKVVLRQGTNDNLSLTTLIADYVNHLQNDGVPLLFELYYRFGHAVPADNTPNDVDLLNMCFANPPPAFPTGINYFATDPADHNAYVPISPPPGDVPIAVDLPYKVAQGQTHTLSILGRPGSRIRLRLDDPPTYGTFTETDYFPVSSDELASLNIPNVFPLAGEWRYEVWYSPDGDTTFETQLTAASAMPYPYDLFFSVPPGASNVPTVIVEAAPPDEIIGEGGEVRTGGVAGDQQYLPPP